jgi:Fe-Mn family superoxide dismutase
MPFELPELSYDKDALEPHIGADTMEVHHDKHHAGYTRKLNNALEGTDWEDQDDIAFILANMDQLPEDVQTAVRNNGGGYANHKLFWEILSPDGGGEPTGAIGERIKGAYGSYDEFKEVFKSAATGQFGSGWAWLYVEPGGDIHVTSTPNQDTPLMEGKTPILGVDVWEHAYYLNYQNERGKYVDAFFNVIDWDAVNEKYKAAVAADEAAHGQSE